MIIYFYFSVMDRLFADVARELANSDQRFVFTGLASGRQEFLEKAPFRQVSFLSSCDVPPPPDLTAEAVRIEREYEVCLSELIQMERHFGRFEKEKRLARAVEIVRTIERDYERHAFQLVFSHCFADFPSAFLHAFAKRHRLKFYYPITARMGGAAFLSDEGNTGPERLKERFQRYVALYAAKPAEFEATKRLVENYVSARRQPYYAAAKTMVFRVGKRMDVSIFFGAIANYIKDRNSYIAYNNPLALPFQRLRRIYRYRAYREFGKRFLSREHLQGLKYFIFPLHFEPEAATLVNGRYLNDQFVVIQMAAKALPADCILIVKEHRVSVGRRPVEFYRKIDALHNVRFVSEHEDVYGLIESSRGVITISSSMALEAIMLQKAVIVFGDVHYNILSQVIIAHNIEGIAACVKQALAFEGYKEAEYLAFFRVITERTYDLSEFFASSYTPKHVDTFVHMINEACELARR
ncbi:MAG TPA: hypothetical protein VHD62_16840 [Opitutaceae bacterium]|nr:hypothetical protein [Opitutaceae bacterium]